MNVNSLPPVPPAGDRTIGPVRFRIPKHVVSARKGDRTILLDVRRGRYYSLDGVGGRIWELMERGEPLSRVEEQLAREYDAPPERIAGDLRTLVEQFRDRGLIS